MGLTKIKIISFLILINLLSCINSVYTEDDFQTIPLESKSIEPKTEYKTQEESVRKTIRDDYLDSLSAMVDTWSSDSSPEQDLILFCLPTTNQEAIQFYNLDYSDNHDMQTAFSKTITFIENKCLGGDTAYLRRYFMLSEFVDGYFAESYFTNVEVMINNNKKYFCEVFPTLDSTKVKRLVSYYVDICK